MKMPPRKEGPSSENHLLKTLLQKQDIVEKREKEMIHRQDAMGIKKQEEMCCMLQEIYEVVVNKRMGNREDSLPLLTMMGKIFKWRRDMEETMRKVVIMTKGENERDDANMEDFLTMMLKIFKWSRNKEEKVRKVVIIRYN